MPRSAAWLYAALAVVLVLTAGVVVLLAHTTVWLGGTAQAAEAVVGVDTIPVRITHVGPVSATSKSDDATVSAILADIATFWSQAIPGTFRPLSGSYVSIDSSARSGTSFCVSSPDQIAGNAYYCPTGDAIVYDSAGLIPVLIGHYGLAGLSASFAHEFGHAIQNRIGPTPADRAAQPQLYPSILIEAQGDCAAGAFLGWTVAGHAEHLRVGKSSMVRAVAPVLDFADPVGVSADDPTAHGLALDRLSSLLVGYREGASACHQMKRADLNPTLGRSGLLDTPAAPRFATSKAVLEAASASISAFAASTAGAPARPALAAADDLAAAQQYGQFAQAAALALAVGHRITASAAGAACFTGAWVQSVFGHVSAGTLGSWGGDADEALNMIRARPLVTFEELIAYADGFASGWSACR